MPRPSKALPLILAAALASACGGKVYGPTRIVEPGAFENGAIKKMAFLGGDTLDPEVQNRIVDGLAERYARNAAAGSVYRREAVLVQLGAVHLAAPDPKKFRWGAATFGNADPKFAQEIQKKLGVDAFYVIWVTEWTPPAQRASGLAEGESEPLDIRREVVAEIFEAGTGKELWHTHWRHDPERAAVRLVPAAEAAKAAEQALQDAIEAVWVSFWIG